MVFRNLQPIKEHGRVNHSQWESRDGKCSQSDEGLLPVGPDGPEQIEWLPQTVGGVVLSDHHVVAAARSYEYDGRHIWRQTNTQQLYTCPKTPVINTCSHIHSPLKHWIHFLRSSLCPPTSNILTKKHREVCLSGRKLKKKTFRQVNKLKKHIKCKKIIS